MTDVPEKITGTLLLAARRVKYLMALKGVFISLLVALLSLLAIMAIDAATIMYSMTLRWALTLVFWGLTGISVFWLVWRPLRRKLGAADIARAMELRNDNLRDERISSTVELLHYQNRRPGAVSASLLRRLADEAVLDAGTVSPRDIFTGHSAKRMGWALASVVVVYLAVFAFWPQPTARLLARAVAPHARIGSLHSGNISVIPGDVRIAAGDSLRVKVRVDDCLGLPVELRTRGRDGRETSERMRVTDVDGEDVFFTSFSPVDDSFSYRIGAGRALTKYYRVEVHPRPRITRLHLEHDYPDYTRLATRSESLNAGERVRTLAGTELALAIEANTSLNAAELLVDGEHAGWGRHGEREGREVLEWRLPAGDRARVARWEVRKECKWGFRNQPVERYELVVEEDKAPSVEIVHPRHSEVRLVPGGFLPMVYEATDDFAIAGAQLRVIVDNDEKELIDLPLPEVAEHEEYLLWRGNALLALSGLAGMDNVRRVQASIVVRDNKPESLGGPNESESRTIVIKPQADPVISRKLAELTDMIQREEQLAWEARQESWPDNREDWLERQQALLDQLGDMMTRDLLEPVREEMQRTAEAQAEAGQAQQEAEQALREALAAESPEEQESALEAVAGWQERAREAQAEAEQAQQDVLEAQATAEEALREAGMEDMADLQRDAREEQQEALAAQQRASESQQAAEEARGEAGESATEEDREEAREAQEEASRDQEEARAAQERAEEAQQQASGPEESLEHDAIEFETADLPDRETITVIGEVDVLERIIEEEMEPQEAMTGPEEDDSEPTDEVMEVSGTTELPEEIGQRGEGGEGGGGGVGVGGEGGEDGGDGEDDAEVEGDGDGEGDGEGEGEGGQGGEGGEDGEGEDSDRTEGNGDGDSEDGGGERADLDPPMQEMTDALQAALDEDQLGAAGFAQEAAGQLMRMAMRMSGEEQSGEPAEGGAAAGENGGVPSITEDDAVAAWGFGHDRRGEGDWTRPRREIEGIFEGLDEGDLPAGYRDLISDYFEAIGRGR